MCRCRRLGPGADIRTGCGHGDPCPPEYRHHTGNTGRPLRNRGLGAFYWAGRPQEIPLCRCAEDSANYAWSVRAGRRRLRSASQHRFAGLRTRPQRAYRFARRRRPYCAGTLFSTGSLLLSNRPASPGGRGAERTIVHCRRPKDDRWRSESPVDTNPLREPGCH